VSKITGPFHLIFPKSGLDKWAQLRIQQKSLYKKRIDIENIKMMNYGWFLIKMDILYIEKPLL